MRFEKLRSGLFVDFDKVVLIEYEPVREFSEKDHKMLYGMSINATLENGLKVPAIYFVKMDNDSEKEFERAEKMCEQFVATNFMKGD